MADSEATAFADILWDETLDRIRAEPHLMQRDAFVQIIGEYLIEDGTLEDIQTCYHRAPAGRSTMETAGYGVNADGALLDLATVELGLRGATITQDRVHRRLRRALTFAERCRDGLYRELEEASPVFDMAQHIHASWKGLEKIRIFLFTDGRATLSHLTADTLGDLPVAYELWDITRLERLITSGSRQDDIDIDLTHVSPPVTCLPAADSKDGYRCLMALVPGQLLADLYEEHGPRLLQRNVRAFLQNRNKVNKGINTTLRTEPARFLAYNNGISATASRATVVTDEDGIRRITRLVDLQIVNGGQTTASLHHAWKRDDADLSQTLVAAKITVVDSALLDELVPRISRYANSQNVIREADFEANSPFHVELERLSRSIWAPAVAGSTRQKHWYYERVRGQYQVDVNQRETTARKRTFKEENRRFGKTDAAKYEMAHLGRPDIVCLGAEKCFQRWTQDVVSTHVVPPDAVYFRKLVAKAILFDGARKLLWAQKLGGYLGQTTAYVVSLLVHRAGDSLDLDELWRAQVLPNRIEQAVTELAGIIRPVLVEPPSSANVTEWCKKEDCWKTIREIEWRGWGQPPPPADPAAWRP